MIDMAFSIWRCTSRQEHLVLLEYLRTLAGADVVAGYFKFDGTRVEGSSRIEIELHTFEDHPELWWYSVKAIEDYAFVREPVSPSCATELVGTETGQLQPDARYWRWVAPTLPGRIWTKNEPPNLKVDFLVFGYRPKALIKHFSNK